MKDEIELQQTWDSACGYARLGMLDEAEALLRTVSNTDGDWYITAQSNLCKLYAGQHRNEDAVRVGQALIAEGRHTLGTVERTMIMLTFLGRHREARETLQLVEGLGRPLAYHAYQMACFGSLEGAFPDALRWLEVEAREPRYLGPRAIGDSDLLPLWRWLASDLENLDDAHRLIRLPLGALCKEALNPRREILMDQNDLKTEPPEFRRLFKHCHAVGMAVLHPLAVAEYPADAAAFRKARREHIEMIVNLIDAGYRRANELVLAAQPRYATEHAAWGNQLGVRYHLTWALARHPEMLSAFRAERGLASMTPLIDSFEAVLRVDPDFCRRMETLERLIDSSPDDAWRKLQETPAAAREHPFFLLRQGLLYTADRDYRRALPIFLHLCEVWPADAAGFANAVCTLIDLGEWEKAAWTLSRAPECYRKFRLFHTQSEEIAERRAAKDGPRPVFKGQPDLGALAENLSNEKGSI